MTEWLVVDKFGEEVLFGFATSHPNTGGLSYVLSTPVLEFIESADRARTASGRVYSLGRQISHRELDEEGQIALRMFLADDPSGYPGADDDILWLSARKMARHLGLIAPPRADPVAVDRFWQMHLRAYGKLRSGWGGAG